MDVKSNGHILPLYDDPDAPDDHTLRERQRYIEATTGAKFEIRVTLTNVFEFGESQTVRVKIAFDGDPRSRYFTIWKSSWLRSRNESCLFSHATTFCPASSTWIQRAFMFGGLDISNDLSLKFVQGQG